METFRKIVLLVTALFFVGFGLAFLFQPFSMMEMIGISLNNSTASSDIRAVYGGLEIGVGLSLLYFLCKDIQAGLILGAFALAGFACGRLVGIVLDGSPSTMTLVLFGSEVLNFVLLAVGIRRPTN